MSSSSLSIQRNSRHCRHCRHRRRLRRCSQRGRRYRCRHLFGFRHCRRHRWYVELVHSISFVSACNTSESIGLLTGYRLAHAAAAGTALTARTHDDIQRRRRQRSFSTVRRRDGVRYESGAGLQHQRRQNGRIGESHLREIPTPRKSREKAIKRAIERAIDDTILRCAKELSALEEGPLKEARQYKCAYELKNPGQAQARGVEKSAL